MRRLILFLTVFSLAGGVYAQSGTATSGIGLPAPIPAPPVVAGISSSVVDSSGNVLILRVASGTIVSTTLTALKTHVTVISSDGKTQNGYDFAGSFEVVGTGLDAVYAMVTTFASTTPVLSRHVVALKVVAGTLPTTLPSIDITGSNIDVKISAGTQLGTDTIAVIVSPIQFLTPGGLTGATATATSTVSLYTSDGTKFTANPNNPITVK